MNRGTTAFFQLQYYDVYDTVGAMTVSTLPLVTVNEAAVVLGVSPGRVRQFCRDRRLGQQVGDRWVIPRDELEQFAKIPRDHGRPPQRNSN